METIYGHDHLGTGDLCTLVIYVQGNLCTGDLCTWRFMYNQNRVMPTRSKLHYEMKLAKGSFRKTET